MDQRRSGNLAGGSHGLYSAHSPSTAINVKDSIKINKCCVIKLNSSKICFYKDLGGLKEAVMTFTSGLLVTVSKLLASNLRICVHRRSSMKSFDN